MFDFCTLAFALHMASFNHSTQIGSQSIKEKVLKFCHWFFHRDYQFSIKVLVEWLCGDKKAAEHFLIHQLWAALKLMVSSQEIFSHHLKALMETRWQVSWQLLRGDHYVGCDISLQIKIISIWWLSTFLFVSKDCSGIVDLKYGIVHCT